MAITDLVPWRKRSNVRVRHGYDNWLDSLHREMNNLFDDFSRGFDIEPFGALRTTEGEFMPRIDICEDEKEIKVTAELPGMDQDDIDVSLSDNKLTIKGEKKEETEDKGRDYYRTERRYGSFYRELPLGEGINTDKVEADFKKGVLTVKLPKLPEVQESRRKIPVKSG